MGERLYFAYGSNINLTQMSRRCPDAEVVGPVTLPGYELLFRCGLATIEPKEGATVPGLLWKLTPLCEKSLDVYEGFPRLYDKRDVTVRDSGGLEFAVMAYVMVPGPFLQPGVPSGAYFQGILDGYRQVGLPESALGDALDHVRQEVRERMGRRDSEPDDDDDDEEEEDEPDEEEEEPEDDGQEKTLYFAYGSNLNFDQMANRCPDAVPLGKAILDNYALAFRGRDDGNGVATVIPYKGRKVHGLLWELTSDNEESLDIREGVPFVYDKRTITVRDENGGFRTAMTYAMTHERNRAPAMPTEAYYNRIRDGYRQNGLPLQALGRAIENLREEVGTLQGEIYLPGSPKREDFESFPKNGAKKRKRRER